jgi:uncharacterized repeat protein (TIGR03803 family)
MHSVNCSLGLLLVATSIFGTATCAGAQSERVLHSFNSSVYPQGGYEPSSGLAIDTAGNLYGVTQSGGTGSNTLCYSGDVEGCGVVFEVSPKHGGGWSERVLHNFGNGNDGYFTQSSLILDTEGDLYGTTMHGGTHGCGTVFELIPEAGGSWGEKILYNFCSKTNEADGETPDSPLIFDAYGNLYGETLYGGPSGSGGSGGTVFELSRKADGSWGEKVLYGFSGDFAAGGYGLTLDAAGNLYGIASGGIFNNGPCNFGCGLVFKLTPHSDGHWAYKVLYDFYSNGEDGWNPDSALLLDFSGNLYGTTFYGGIGPCDCGTVFKLTPGPGGEWTEQILHSFVFNNVDGLFPVGLAADTAGNLYGTTQTGGAYSNDGYGTAFELMPQTDGSWTETILHNFGKGTDGLIPVAGPIFDAYGNLYGTTGGGGTQGGGTVFAIKP